MCVCWFSAADPCMFSGFYCAKVSARESLIQLYCVCTIQHCCFWKVLSSEIVVLFAPKKSASWEPAVNDVRPKGKRVAVNCLWAKVAWLSNMEPWGCSLGIPTLSCLTSALEGKYWQDLFSWQLTKKRELSIFCGRHYLCSVLHHCQHKFDYLWW